MQSKQLFLFLLCLLVCTLQAALIWTPTGGNTANMNPMSHGGGYNPVLNEYWYPSWSGSTVYRYSSNYTYLGTFNTPGHQHLMQIWGDTDGSYYTANWGYQSIQKISAGTNGMNGSVLWTYNVGTTSAGVTADQNYVYINAWTSNQIVRLNKNTGAYIDSLTMSGPYNKYTYGAMAVVDGYLLYGNADGYISRYSLANNGLQYIDSYYTGTNIYSLAFDGYRLNVSPNSSYVYQFNVSDVFAYTQVPEPASIMLLGMALVWLAAKVKR